MIIIKFIKDRFFLPKQIVEKKASTESLIYFNISKKPMKSYEEKKSRGYRTLTHFSPVMIDVDEDGAVTAIEILDGRVPQIEKELRLPKIAEKGELFLEEIGKPEDIFFYIDWRNKVIFFETLSHKETSYRYLVADGIIFDLAEDKTLVGIWIDISQVKLRR